MKDLEGWIKAFFNQFEWSRGKIVRPGWLILLLMGVLFLCNGRRLILLGLSGGLYVAAALAMAIRGTRAQYGRAVNHRGPVAVAETFAILAAHVLFIVDGVARRNRTGLILGVLLTAATVFFLFVFFVLRWDGKGGRRD